MKKKLFGKKAISLILAGVMVAGIATGCGAKKTEGGEGTTAAAELKEITIAASATPHAELLEEAKPLMKEKGYDLKIQIFDDYVQPNEVVESGDMLANYMQHLPYLDDFNAKKGTHIVSVGGIHYEPFGIYPGKKTSLDDIADGDTIAVPNDPTNEARALLLLQDNGIITLKEGVGISATIKDIESKKFDIKIQELEAAQIPRVVSEVEYAIMNGNYALEAGYVVSKDALAYEQADSEAAKTYVNIIGVKEGNEDNAGIKELVNILKSDEIKKFMETKYEGAVVPF